MPEYRLYHMVGDHIRGVTAITAVNDYVAFEQAAHKLKQGESAELWRGAVRLKTFNLPTGGNPAKVGSEGR